MNDKKHLFFVRNKRIILIVLFILVSTLLYCYAKNQIDHRVRLSAESKETELKVKMLSSDDPRIVLSGIILNYYPDENLKLSEGGGGVVYTFAFYGIKLTESQYTSLVDYFQSIGQVSPYNYTLEDTLYADYVPIEGLESSHLTPEWLRYWYNKDYNFVMKDGYVCLYPIAETKIDGVWRPENYGYNNKFVAPSPLVFRCSNIANPGKNTLENVGRFIKDFLETTNIAKIEIKDLTLSKEYEYLNTEYFEMPNHTSAAKYTSKYDKFSGELIKSINDELTIVAEYLNKALWKTKIEETTNDKLIRNWYSSELVAKNNIFECTIEVGVWGDKYKYYIPDQKNLKEKYTNYNDEEFEKYVLGGKVRRSIYCFKSLDK